MGSDTSHCNSQLRDIVTPPTLHDSAGTGSGMAVATAGTESQSLCAGSSSQGSHLSRRRQLHPPGFPSVLSKGTDASSPIVTLQDVPKDPKGSSASVIYKPKTTRIITKDLIQDLVTSCIALACLVAEWAAQVAQGTLGALGVSVSLSSLPVLPSIPQEKPQPCLIIGEKEYERIKESARAIMDVERWDRLKTLKARQDAAFEALKKAQMEEQRKAELEGKRDHRRDVEEELQQEEQKLLQQVMRMQLEQEEEMRELNALFLNAKCNMIRDKQVLEKQMIHKELAKEEKRLDKMLEMEWEKGMEVQEELERCRKRELIRARQDIVKQMEQNAEERALRAEELYQEGQRQLERLEQMKREDRKVEAGNRRDGGRFPPGWKGIGVGTAASRIRALVPRTWWHPREVVQSLPALSEEKEEKGALGLVASKPVWHFQAWEQKQQLLKQIHAEIKHFNVESQRLKDKQRERERLEDKWILEHQQQKAERKAALEAEREQLRLEKEKKLVQLRAMQEQAQDWQAERDALRAKRNQEVADREWWRRELEKAQRKAEMEQQLKQDRLQQVAQKEQYLAMQVEQDRQEFQRVLRAHQEQLEQEKLQQEQRELQQRAHAEDLRRQIQELRQQRQREQAAIIEEGQQQEQEVWQRSQRLAQLRQQKLQEFRATGIPETYFAQMECKAQSRVSTAPS
ncbi:hypothetical protein Nmel_007734 [Mimus melanotis]